MSNNGCAGQIEEILDGAIATKGYVIKPLFDAKIDLIKMDFEHKEAVR
jgi:hypothetical protein